MQATGSHCYLIVNNAITKRFLVKQPLSDWFHLTGQSKNTTPTPSATCSCLTSNMGDYYQAICAWCPVLMSIVLMFSWLFGEKKIVVWSINHLLSFICCQFCIVVSDHVFLSHDTCSKWHYLHAFYALFFFFQPFFSCKPMIHPNVNNAKTSVTLCL